MLRVFSLIESVARSDAPVLIRGESGTGKELVARALHGRSARKRGRFVALNCGALTESMIESELFGHVRGAFTGAFTSRRGLFEEASSGTLFLDEVGELSLPSQVRLLRALQEGEVRPVGANESRKVDARVVAATHRNLEDRVMSGQFREDLYYRLDVVTIRLPPLRERVDDIPLLARHFLKGHVAETRRDVDGFEPEAMEWLKAQRWPGNARQLDNAIARAVLVSKTDRISLEELKAGSPSATRERRSLPAGPVPTPPPMGPARMDFERAYVAAVMQRARGNVTVAARIAGMDRSNFRRLLKRHE